MLFKFTDQSLSKVYYVRSFGWILRLQQVVVDEVGLVQILLKLIMLHVTKVQDQNKKYFENRALELIHKDKKDRLATVQLNIIMKSLKVTRGELLLK